MAHCILDAMEAERQPMWTVSGALPPAAMVALQESGFVVFAGPYPVERLGVVADAYDAEVGVAAGDDIRIGSTSTRVVDFVNRGPLFDPLYVYPPLLDAAARIIGPSFKHSSLHARTVRPGSTVLDIHVDVESDSIDWPLLGFILMIDAFTADNGATRFIPRSHHWGDPPRDGRMQEYTAQLVSACGPAGSLLVFNGSTWHGRVSTAPTGHVGRCKARSFREVVVPAPTSAATCHRRPARGSVPLRVTCSQSHPPAPDALA